jgi:hypothetical protein
MAKEFKDTNNNAIKLDWATEETASAILRTLNGKSPAGKAKDAATKKSGKLVGRLGDMAKKTGTGLDKVNRVASRTAQSLDDVDETAQSVTKGLLGVVGGLGILGAGIGLAAKVVDSFITAQIAAIQSGFSFSDQLIESRSALADIGLGMDQFSNILATQGESIRQLGASGFDAADTFSDMVHAARNATEQMGYYGLSSEEIANSMADLTGTLVRAGVTGSNLFSSAVDSFSLLNREVLGYARLTGRNSRDIMRNRSAVDTDALFLSALGQIGPGAVTAAHGMTDAFSAAFGDASPELIDIMKRTFLTVQSGVEQRAPDELAALEVSGMRAPMEEYARNLLGANGDASTMLATTSGFIKSITDMLQASEDEILSQALVFRSGNGSPLSAFYDTLLEATVSSRTINSNMNDSVVLSEAFTGGLDDTTRTLIKFNNEMQVALAKLRALILNQFDVGTLTAITDAIVKFDFEKTANQFKDIISTIHTWTKDFFSEGGSIRPAMILGIAALWTAPALISAMVAGMSAMIGMVGMGMSGLLLPLLKKIPILAPLFAAGDGALDQERIDSGQSLLNRMSSGMVEKALQVLDITANAAYDVAGLDGYLRSNLAGYFRAIDLDTEQKRQELETPFQGAPIPEVQAFDPKTSEMYENYMNSTPATIDRMPIDSETRAILQNQSFARMEEYMRRIAEETERTRKEIQNSQ